MAVLKAKRNPTSECERLVEATRNLDGAAVKPLRASD
jgi:hypothetical protein